MLKRICTGLLVLGLIVGLGAVNPASATEPNLPPPCGGCPPPPPPPPPCGVNELVTQTQIFVGDCAGCYDVRARLLEECSPCSAVIDAVQFNWCNDPCDCDCSCVPWPAAGLNGVLWIEDFSVECGIATVTLRLIADPAVFDGGVFGDFPRGLEVTVNGVTNVCCAVFDCSLSEGGPLSIDWGWLFGGPVKIKVKASAKASVKVGSGGKYYAKASSKTSVSIKAGSFKYSAKASAKASVKVGSNGKYSAKASAKASVKMKGSFVPPPWALAIAQAYAGVGPAFGGAFAKAWAGWLYGPPAPAAGAVAVAGTPGYGKVYAKAKSYVKVNLAGGAFFGGPACDFGVLFVGGCECSDCGCNQGHVCNLCGAPLPPGGAHACAVAR